MLIILLYWFYHLRPTKSKKQVFGTNDYSLVKCSDLEVLDDGTVVDMELLYKMGFKCSLKQQAGFKLLGNGELTKKLTVKANKFSASAKKAIEDLGGTAEVI